MTRVLSRLFVGFLALIVVVILFAWFVLLRPVDGAAYTARFVLRLWRSGIHLTGTDARDEPLWIGTVVEERLEELMGILVVTREMPDLNGPRDRLNDEMPSARRVSRDVVAPGWDGVVLIGNASW